MRITTEKGKKDKIHIYVDGEYKMTVDEAFWFSQGIPEKSEIGEEELADLENSVVSRRAFNKAVDIISQREHSKREVITKLIQRGYSRETAQAATEKLEEYGYIDDVRFASLFARELKERKKFGKGRIKQELMRKGISRETADSVLSEIEEDPCREITEILRKKYPSLREDEKIRNRAFNALLRYGYGISDVRNAINSFDNGEEEYYDIEDF